MKEKVSKPQKIPIANSKICIYCKRSIKKINEEHLFPKAFGCTKKYTLDCLCEECNRLLGAELINYFSYDSLEGVIKTKKGSEIFPHKNKYNNLLFQIPQNQLSLYPFNGAFLTPESSGLNLPSQIGIKKGEEYKFYIFSDKLMKKEFIQQLKTQEILILARSKNALDQMICKLKEYDISLNKVSEGVFDKNNQEHALVAVSFMFDGIVRRCLSYIAFNLLAYAYGEQIALENTFNEIRQFVRFGHENRNKFYFRRIKLNNKINNHYFSLFTENGICFAAISLYNSGFIYFIELGKLKLTLPEKNYLYYIQQSKLNLVKGTYFNYIIRNSELTKTRNMKNNYSILVAEKK